MRAFTLLALCAAGASSLATLDIFRSGDEPGVLQFRIPALVRTGRGTLLAFAEARTDPATDCAYKWLAVRRSVDEGVTWSGAPSVAAAGRGNTTQATGNEQCVWVAATGRVVCVFGVKALGARGGGRVACSPGSGVFVVDDGGSDGLVWGAPRNISAELGGMTGKGGWGGVVPGPGAGIVLTTGAHAGRIVMSGSNGPYARDVAFYSDDNGASWRAGETALARMDESVPVELSNGSVLLNMRNAHDSACDCRAISRSDDGGATWSLPIAFDPVLISPECQASALRIGARNYFANPASTRERADITVRRTLPDSTTWENATLLIAPGLCFGGYSSLAGPLTDGTLAGILYERNNSAVAVISYTSFPVDF